MVANKLLLLILVFSSTVYGHDLAHNEPITPLPENNDIDKTDKKYLLGEKLFQDKILSKENSVSCLSCHNIYSSGADNRRVSIGFNQTAGDINTPTIFNSRYNFRQFWDGRAHLLNDQIDGPIQNPKEMHSSWDEVIVKLKNDHTYSQLFQEAYGRPPAADDVKDALVTFENSLTTPNSLFDRWLRGENTLSADQLEGYTKFKAFGCIACHQGMNVGGNMFQTMGVMGHYFTERGSEIVNADFGRFNVTGKESDKFVFKVPSLRNVALTAPYFHDGSAHDLPTAITQMARYQLGLKISPKDRDAIVAFLKTLTGENPMIRKPASDQKDH